MPYPAFLAEVALPQSRKNLRFSIVTGYGTALLFGLLASAAHGFGLLPFVWPLYALVAFKLFTNTLAYLSLRYDALVMELEERNHQLVEAGKHKSQFMANVTHELRTPIHGICGLSDLVSAGIYGPVTEKQKDAHRWC